MIQCWHVRAFWKGLRAQMILTIVFCANGLISNPAKMEKFQFKVHSKKRLVIFTNFLPTEFVDFLFPDSTNWFAKFTYQICSYYQFTTNLILFSKSFLWKPFESLWYLQIVHWNQPTICWLKINIPGLLILMHDW
jgi:hypothetical protein